MTRRVTNARDYLVDTSLVYSYIGMSNELEIFLIER